MYITVLKPQQYRFFIFLLWVASSQCNAAYYDPTLPPQLSVSEVIRVPVVKPKPKPVDYNSIMKLNMIVSSGHSKQHYCVINDEIYTEGEHVGIYIVYQILPDRVVLMNGSEKLWLCLVTDKVNNQCY